MSHSTWRSGRSRMPGSRSVGEAVRTAYKALATKVDAQQVGHEKCAEIRSSSRRRKEVLFYGLILRD